MTAKIVSTPGVCGGRPRLDGHRLDIAWYGELFRCHGPNITKALHEGWPYLTEDEIKALSDYYDSHPEWHEGEP